MQLAVTHSVAAADVNGDNKTDIIVANENSATVSVLLNTGNGTFATQTTYATGTNPFCGSSRCQWRQQTRHYCRKLWFEHR